MGVEQIARELRISVADVRSALESGLRKVRDGLGIDSLPEGWFRRAEVWESVRDPDGVGGGKPRLTEADVVAIRAARSRGERAVTLAHRFGLTVGSVNKIVGGRAWKHVPMPSGEASR